jgi:hypothetical protein
MGSAWRPEDKNRHNNDLSKEMCPRITGSAWQRVLCSICALQKFKTQKPLTIKLGVKLTFDSIRK